MANHCCNHIPGVFGAHVPDPSHQWLVGICPFHHSKGNCNSGGYEKRCEYLSTAETLPTMTTLAHLEKAQTMLQSDRSDMASDRLQWWDEIEQWQLGEHGIGYFFLQCLLRQPNQPKWWSRCGDERHFGDVCSDVCKDALVWRCVIQCHFISSDATKKYSVSCDCSANTLWIYCYTTWIQTVWTTVVHLDRLPIPQREGTFHPSCLLWDMTGHLRNLTKQWKIMKDYYRNMIMVASKRYQIPCWSGCAASSEMGWVRGQPIGESM